MYQDTSISIYVRESVDMDGRRDARGSPQPVCRLRAVPCARQSRSIAAQLGACDSGYCLRTSLLGSARHGLAVIMQSAHAKAKQRRANRAPLDFEDGEMAARCTTSLASFPPTVPRRAWQLANSVAQLLTSDASGGGIWAWHTTPNVTSATRIAARLLQRRLLQRTGDESAAAIAKSWSCSEGQMSSLTSAYG
jgi:hypothetical protein